MPSIISATTTNGLSTSADNSGSLQLATNNGTTAVTIDTSQKVGIGTASPTEKLSVAGSVALTDVVIPLNGTTAIGYIGNSNTISGGSSTNIGLRAESNMLFATGGSTERMRIDSSGLVLVNRTSASGTSRLQVSGISGSAAAIETFHTSTATQNHLQFNNGSVVGAISTNGSSTSYNTSSDYRLKENIAPMTGALAKVAQLKPVTYKWKVDGSSGQGFIAHELQAIVPDCVTGQKDGVDAEGNPKYQGIDTSFLVATLTAAIQELKAEFDAYKATHP